MSPDVDAESRTLSPGEYTKRVAFRLVARGELRAAMWTLDNAIDLYGFGPADAAREERLDLTQPTVGETADAVLAGWNDAGQPRVDGTIGERLERIDTEDDR